MQPGFHSGAAARPLSAFQRLFAAGDDAVFIDDFARRTVRYAVDLVYEIVMLIQGAEFGLDLPITQKKSVKVHPLQTFRSAVSTEVLVISPLICAPQ